MFSLAPDVPSSATTNHDRPSYSQQPSIADGGTNPPAESTAGGQTDDNDSLSDSELIHKQRHRSQEGPADEPREFWDYTEQDEQEELEEAGYASVIGGISNENWRLPVEAFAQRQEIIDRHDHLDRFLLFFVYL